MDGGWGCGDYGGSYQVGIYQVGGLVELVLLRVLGFGV